MALRHRGAFAWAIAGAVVALLVWREWGRPRPAAAPPVESQPTANLRETARLADGFSWITSKEGRKLFELLGQSLVGLQGGASLVEGVRKLTFYTDDGRPVVLEARAARVQQLSGSETDVEAALEGDVVVRAPEGTVLRTDRLVFNTVQRQLSSPGPADLKGTDLDARLAGFVYTPDSKLVELRGPVLADLGGGQGWRVDSGAAQYNLASGELVFASAFRAARREGQVLGGQGRVKSPAPGAASKVSADGPVLLSGVQDGRTWRLAGGRLSATGVLPREKSQVQDVEVGPPTSLLVEDAGAGQGGRGAIHAETWRVTAQGRTGAARAAAAEGFSARWTSPASAEPWQLAGDSLELERDESGRLAHVVARGRVTAQGPQGFSAQGRQLDWSADRPDEVVLTGDRARARQGSDIVEAAKVTAYRKRRALVAEGAPLTEAGALRSGDSPLFRGDEPVRVRSARVIMDDAGGPIEFEGPVQAWQADATLRAAHMRVDRREGRVIADGDVQMLAPAGGAGGGQRRVKLATEHLEYDSNRREAHLTGGATYEEPTGAVQSSEMFIRLQPQGGGVDSLDATGSVVATVQGHRGRCDRLEWRGGAAGVVTLIGEKNLAQLESPSQGVLKAARIRYDLERRVGQSEGGGGRGTAESRPPASGGGEPQKEPR